MMLSPEKIGQALVGNSSPDYEDTLVFQIKPFKDNDRSVSHRDTLLKSIVSLKSKQITFVIHGNQSDIKFFVRVPKSFKHFFENSFFSNFPTSDLQEISTKSFPRKPAKYLHFSKDATVNSQSIFTKDGTYMDPMNGIMALYNSIPSTSYLTIYFTYFFKKKDTVLKTIGKFFAWARGTRKKWEEVKPETNAETSKKELFASIGYTIKSSDPYVRETIEKNLMGAFAPLASNRSIKAKTTEKFKDMNFNQAINFFHMPTIANFYKWLEYSLYRKLPYPTHIPTEKNSDIKDLTILWTTDYRGEAHVFWIKKEDKFRHMYIVGKTWTGKSTFIANMVKSDMMAGNGLCLLDPHGELVDIVMEHIPSYRINDVIMFDVSDMEYPIGFNLLQAETEQEKVLIASGVVWAFYKLFGNSWWPRLEYILRNVVLSIIDYPNATIMHILRVLVDKEFREEVISHITDSVILKFWTSEFSKRNDKQREEAVWPITNKVGQFLSSRLVRNIFWQPRTKLNLRRAMDEGKIILVNLSKGKIWEDNANMVGSLLVTKFQIDAMSRADIAASQRRDFYLYIDEFQNFATESFVTILSEARKYKLSLIIANQYTSQIDEKIRNAIFGNVGTTIAFTVGKDDADVITGQFKWLAEVNDLISLPKYTAYTRLMIDGISSDPFSMKTLPISTPDGSLELIDKIRKQSRQRYAMKKDELEKLMDAWSKKSFSLQEKVAEKAKLEGLGIDEKEFENLQDMYVQQKYQFFQEFTLEDNEPDYVIFDTKFHKEKAVWTTKPKDLDNVAILKVKKGQEIKKPDGTVMHIKVDIYEHMTIQLEDKSRLQIWVGDKEHILQQLEDAYGDTSFFKVCPNVSKREKEVPAPEVKTNAWPVTTTGSKTVSKSSSETSVAPSGNFTVKDIKLGQSYEGYVKLSYNYGLFVTVKWVEGLLHKKSIKAPAGVERKKYYNIWDKIQVKAEEFKDINGEKKVVWTQL